MGEHGLKKGSGIGGRMCPGNGGVRGYPHLYLSRIPLSISPESPALNLTPTLARSFSPSLSPSPSPSPTPTPSPCPPLYHAFTFLADVWRAREGSRAGRGEKNLPRERGGDGERRGDCDTVPFYPCLAHQLYQGEPHHQLRE